MRARPIAPSNWGRSSGGAKSGVWHGLRSSGVRGFRQADTMRRSRNGRRGVRKRVVLVMRVNPTTQRHWGISSGKVRCGVRRGLPRSGAKAVRAGRTWTSSNGKRGEWRPVALGTRAHPTTPENWGRSSGRVRCGVGDDSPKSRTPAMPRILGMACRHPAVPQQMPPLSLSRSGFQNRHR